MGLPSGVGYDTNIVPAPDGDVDGFTFIKDGSDFSSSFLADINTGDGSRARFAWDIDEGEMAFDWIADDVQVDPGVIRIGAGRIVYAASSDAARLVRSYAPNTRSTAYAVTDTYGQYNAYDDDWVGSWPLVSDFSDRTSNQNNGVGSGGIVAGEFSGALGSATSFDGVADKVTVMDSAEDPIGGTQECTIMCMAYPDDLSSSNDDRPILTKWGTYSSVLSANTLEFLLHIDVGGTGPDVVGATWDDTNSVNVVSADDAAVSVDQWQHMAMTRSAMDIKSFLDGSLSASDSIANTDINSVSLDTDIGYGVYGGLNNYFDGGLQHVALFSSSKSSDFIAYEYSQTSDNSTFWGTPTWVPGDTGLTIDAESGALSLSGKSADILVASKLDLSNGSFVLTGYDADLTKAKILEADQVSISLSGNDADLLQDLIFNAGSGYLSLTGQDSDLEKAPTIFAESGALSLSGQDADLLADKKSESSHGTLSFSGSDIDTFLSKVIGAGSGLLTFTGRDADLMRSGILSANTGVISLSGKDATLNILAAGKIEAETGYFSLSGASIDIEKNTFVDSETGALSLSGKSADFIFDRIFDAESGILSIAGLPADVVSGIRRFFALKTNIIFDIDGEVTLKNNIQFDIDDGKALKANVIFDIEEDG